MKNKYLVIHDYQHGGVGFYILADTLTQVVEKFGSPCNRVIDPGIDEQPIVKYMGDKLSCYDIEDLPAGLK